MAIEKISPGVYKKTETATRETTLVKENLLKMKAHYLELITSIEEDLAEIEALEA